MLNAPKTVIKLGMEKLLFNIILFQAKTIIFIWKQVVPVPKPIAQLTSRKLEHLETIITICTILLGGTQLV